MSCIQYVELVKLPTYSIVGTYTRFLFHNGVRRFVFNRRSRSRTAEGILQGTQMGLLCTVVSATAGLYVGNKDLLNFLVRFQDMVRK